MGTVGTVQNTMDGFEAIGLLELLHDDCDHVFSPKCASAAYTAYTERTPSPCPWRAAVPCTISMEADATLLLFHYPGLHNPEFAHVYSGVIAPSTPRMPHAGCTCLRHVFGCLNQLSI